MINNSYINPFYQSMDVSSLLVAVWSIWFQEEVLNCSPSIALQFPWREVILYATLAYRTSQLGQHCVLHRHTQTPTA